MFGTHLQLLFRVHTTQIRPNSHTQITPPIKMSTSSSSSYRRYTTNQDVTNKTHCNCKPPHPIPIQTAWTTDNPGRRFRGCPIRDKSKKCGVYGFLDVELPSDYYKGLVYSLHEENKALKRMNRMPVGVMDGTSGLVSNNSFSEKHLKSELTFIKLKFEIYDRILLVVCFCVLFLTLVTMYDIVM